MVDPFDEIAFLGMECRMLGAPDIAGRMYLELRRRLDDPIEPQLFEFYGAFRAVMRARMALSHLVDGSALDPAPWTAKTDRYLGLAVDGLTRCGP